MRTAASESRLSILTTRARVTTILEFVSGKALAAMIKAIGTDKLWF
jgi:hypothetical protein